MTFERRKFTGTINYSGHSFAVDFAAWSGNDSRLEIEVEGDPATIHELLFLEDQMGEPGSFVESLVLDGVSSAGDTLFSDTAVIRSPSVGTSGTSIKLSARKAKVIVRLTKHVLRPWMSLWFRGFESGRNPLVNMSLGTVQVIGKATRGSDDDTSGRVTVQAEADTELDGWVEKADDFLTLMHRGLGFANGGRLQTPRLSLRIGDRLEVTYYEGAGFSRSLPPLHKWNQGPFIEALCQRFDNPKPLPEALWTAISWLNSDSSFYEGRFLMSMTALEAIIECVIPKNSSTVLPKVKFKAVKEALFAALSEAEIDPTSREVYCEKLHHFNGRSLRQKIEVIRDQYDLPKEIFTDKKIRAIIQARNAIVHKGESAGSREIWPKVVFVRELIAHIAFHEIGYYGPYQSYVSGYRMVDPALEK